MTAPLVIVAPSDSQLDFIRRLYDDGLRAHRRRLETMGAPDAALRKRAKRSGREQGCWTYIDGEALQRAGFEPGELPYYRVVGYARSKNAGSAIISLYRER